MKRFDIVEAVRLLISGVPVAKVGDFAWYRMEDGKIFIEDASGAKKQQVYIVFMSHDLISKDWIEVDEEFKALTLRMGCK